MKFLLCNPMDRKCNWLVFIIFLCLTHWSNQSVPTAVVQLANGSPVQGMEMMAVNGKVVSEFLGIPYAEPPVGQRRFRPPLPKKPWLYVFNASSFPNTCYQERDMEFPDFHGAEMWNPNTEISEDCLYLNLWVPGRLDPTKKLTVMVWIYGGGFVTGTSSLDVYDGKIFSTEENVIIVSMNYRVTIFGFLYTGGPEAPGNVGLLDQLEALKWVRTNIHLFGGDPEDVTLFGESAGSASVSLHSLSPLSQPYFKRFILQSGAATNPWSTTPAESLLNNALEVGERLQCNISKKDPDWRNLVDCLIKQPAKVVLENSWTTDEFLYFPWTPVMDNHFLIEEPRASLNNGNFKSGQLLVGSNLNEANFFITYHLKDVYKKEILFTKDELITSDHLFEQCAYELLPRSLKSNAVVRHAILFEYKDWELPANPVNRQDALDKMLGDYYFTCSVNEFAQKYEQAGNTVYYYYFTHRSTQQTWPAWMGALHGWEINFIFGEPLNTVKWQYTAEERELSRKFMRYWANFARTGNPNVNQDGSWMADQWPTYTKNQQYLTLTVNSSKIGHGPRRRQCVFWKQYLPRLRTATASLSETEVRWKQQFSRWQNEYFLDWRHQMEQYQRLQKFTYV